MRGLGGSFWWLLAGRGVDALGNAMHPIALGFAVLELFDSVTSLGVVVGSAVLGQVVFVLLGGVVADRLPRAVVMVASNIAAALLQLFVVAMFVAQWDVLWLLVLLSFLTGATAAFDGPASTALVVQVTPTQRLQQGNSLLLVVRRSGFMVGSAIGGVAVATFGSSVALAANAASFVLAGICFAQVRTSSPEAPADPGAQHATVVGQLAQGWDEFRSRTWLWLVVAVFAVINACWFGGFRVLGLAVADQTFGPTAWGTIVGVEGIGALLAGAVLVRGRSLRRPLLVGVLGTVVGVGPLVGLALDLGALELGLLSVLGGAGMMVFGILWETALHQHIPADRLARVSSFDQLGSYAALPLGGYLVGPLADGFGILPVVQGCAIVSVAGCLVLLASRSVRDLPDLSGSQSTRSRNAESRAS